MRTIDTLKAEHDGVLVVLAELERAVEAAAAGQPLPRAIFLDIQEFIDTFVDKCHHGKEEAAVFPRLADGPAAAVIAKLKAEHVTGEAQASAFFAAVRDYAPGDRQAGARLAMTAREYAANLRRHIAAETDELFPAIEASLKGDDERINAAFERIERDQIGPGTHERLHAMIEGLAARIDPYTPTLAARR